MPITKVLVANRGEIAVRVIRAAADAGLASVAVYADPDADGLFVRLADEAFALNGMTPAQTYTSTSTSCSTSRPARRRRGSTGYGFLAENATFAQAVIDAGLDVDRPAARGDRVAGRQGAGPPHRAEGRRPRAGHARPWPTPTRS